MLRTGTAAGSSPGQAYTGLLRGTGTIADHHGSNRSACQGSIQGRIRRHLCHLPQNKLGICVQNIGGELRTTGVLDHERSLWYANNYTYWGL